MASQKISALTAATSVVAADLRTIVQGGVNKKADGTIPWTWSGLLTAAGTGAASTPGVQLTGAWFSGGSTTTTKPQLLVEASTAVSTGWSASGTGLGVNAASGFAGLLLDLQVNGLSKFSVDSTGAITGGLSFASLSTGKNVTAAMTVGEGGTFTIGEAASTSPALNVNGPAGTKRSVLFQTSGVARWNTRAGLGVESGSNLGSSYIVEAFDDAGVSIDTPIVLLRAAAGSYTLARPFVGSTAGVASVPTLLLTGTWFTGGSGTTTKPMVLIETAGATTNAWNTSGTGFGVNAANGFTGLLMDLQKNGTTEFSVGATGNVAATGRITASGAGVASNAGIVTTGSWFTGGSSTTTKPQLLVEGQGTTSTAWSTNGTGIGANSIGAFTGNLIDLQFNALSRFSISATGVIVAGSTAGTMLTLVSTLAQSATSGAAIVMGCNNSAVMTSGNRLGAISWKGATASNGTFNTSASIEGLATETWSGTAAGSRVVFSTVANTTLTLVAALSIEQDQTVKIASGKNLQLGNAYVAGTIVGTGSVILYDSTGTAYRVPCLV